MGPGDVVGWVSEVVRGRMRVRVGAVLGGTCPPPTLSSSLFPLLKSRPAWPSPLPTPPLHWTCGMRRPCTTRSVSLPCNFKLCLCLDLCLRLVLVLDFEALGCVDIVCNWDNGFGI